MNSFDTVEVMFEFSKAIRHGIISLESLKTLEGVDGCEVSALTDSVRQVHDQAARYIVALISRSSNPQLT